LLSVFLDESEHDRRCTLRHLACGREGAWIRIRVARPSESPVPRPAGAAMGLPNLRILHLIDTGGPGGAETVFVELVRGLADRVAHQSLVVPEEDWLAEALRSHRFTPTIRATRPGGFDLDFLFWLTNQIRTARIDVIQTHLLGSATYGALAGWMTGIPVVCTFHGTPDLDEGSKLLPVKLRII